MKKVLIVTMIMLQLYESKAQSVSVNYIKEFVKDSKNYIKNNKFTPYAVSGISVAYSHELKKLPLTINVSAVSRTRKPPPWIIKYPDPLLLSTYAIDNNIEADSASLSNSKSSSIDLLVGAGYSLALSNKFILIINADFGLSINSKQSLNYYFQNRLTRTLEVENTQFVFNPNIQARYFITNNIGINLSTGYNNTGGINGGVGIAVRSNRSANKPRRRWDPHHCLICGGWHLRRGCPRPY